MMMNNPTMLSYIRREQPVLERLLTNYPKQITAALTATSDHPQHWLILATGSRLNAANTARLYMQKTAALQVTIAAATSTSLMRKLIPVSMLLSGFL